MEKERIKKPLNFVDIHDIKKFLLIVFSMKGREQSVAERVLSWARVSN